MHGVTPYRHRRSWPQHDRGFSEYVVGIAFAVLPLFVLAIVAITGLLSGQSFPVEAMTLSYHTQMPAP